jgi:hypothetical protein
LPFSKKPTPRERCSVLKTAVGLAANGAARVNNWSRCGTFAFGSPPSSASVHSSVAGSVGTQRMLRGPVGTPSIGTLSCSGRSATTWTTFPVRPHTSVTSGNAEYGYRYENGFFTRLTSRYLPSGDGSTPVMMPGEPRGTDFSSDSTFTIAS